MKWLLLIWLCVGPTAFAADPVAGTEQLGEGLIPGLPPGPPPATDQVDPLTHQIARTLRCPVCQGLSVADSTSEAAVMFQRRIEELVAAGYTEEQIGAIWSGNTLRVWREVEEVARRLQDTAQSED